MKSLNDTPFGAQSEVRTTLLIYSRGGATPNRCVTLFTDWVGLADGKRRTVPVERQGPAHPRNPLDLQYSNAGRPFSRIREGDDTGDDPYGYLGTLRRDSGSYVLRGGEGKGLERVTEWPEDTQSTCEPEAPPQHVSSRPPPSPLPRWNEALRPVVECLESGPGTGRSETQNS